ncbi:MAG: metal-dependent transcriptional regulator [Balneolaceae bacterium]|nr:MAG: metal-dependent transcriptional regulator [Balneolaceae bacterium]
MATQTIENYLKALFSLAEQTETINVTDLAKRMEVSLPTVNSMVNRLASMGFVKYEKYKPLELSDAGKKQAALIIRKHRLTEMFLAEKMGIGWDEVHEIAEHIEHLKSPLFFDRLDEMLGYPSHDPHGSPIPDKNGQVEAQDLRKLSEFSGGDIVILKALGNTTEQFLRYLDEKELALESVIRIVKVEEFDGSMTLSWPGQTAQVFSEKVCSVLLVNAMNRES